MHYSLGAQALLEDARMGGREQERDDIHKLATQQVGKLVTRQLMQASELNPGLHRIARLQRVSMLHDCRLLACKCTCACKSYAALHDDNANPE